MARFSFILALTALVATTAVDAEMGAVCTADSDCANSEFCLYLPMKATLMKLMMGKLPSEEQVQMMMEKLQAGETPEGRCHPKQKMYQPCIMDNFCETGMCFQGPIPGDVGPLAGKPFVGRCVECGNDGECSGGQYCSIPVINAQCIESLLLGLSAKKNEMDAKKHMKGMMKPDFLENLPEEVQGIFMKVHEMIAGMMQKAGGPPPPPPFPRARGGRTKRGLSHFAINAPKMTCMDKKPANSPCKRSPECQSDKCTVEGSCAV